MTSDTAADLAALVPKIAEELSLVGPGGWEGGKDNGFTYLRRGDEELDVMNWRGKLTITGCVPYDHRVSSRPRPEIGVSAARGAKSIAAEINRRLLPEYRQNLADQKGRIAAADTADDLAYANAQQLAAVSNGHLLEKDGRGRYRVTPTRIDGINYGEFDVAGTYVRIELSVTPDMAAKMLEAAYENRMTP